MGIIYRCDLGCRAFNPDDPGQCEAHRVEHASRDTPFKIRSFALAVIILGATIGIIWSVLSNPY